MYTFYFPHNDVRRALRNYAKARARFISAIPDAQRAEKDFQRAYEDLMNVLSDEAVRGPVEKLLSVTSPADLKIGADPDFIAFEKQVISSLLGLSANESEAIVLAGLESFNAGGRITSVDALVMILKKSHNDIIEKTKEARMETRKEKKKRKKQIVSSSSYIGVGIAAILGNVFVLHGTAFAVPSVGAGAGAVANGAKSLYDAF